MKHKWLKLDYIPVLNVHLITESLGLHKFCILERTSSKEKLFAFWVKIISLYVIRMVYNGRFRREWQSLNFDKEYLFAFETLVFATSGILSMHNQLVTLQRESKAWNRIICLL